jgi:glutathione-specific gamma-glutamylcyclotransferase
MSDFWVFGYGSLMWQPGFTFAEQIPARLAGAHRALCVYSFVYRGTREKPGLVLGLDRGGSCHGVAYRVEEHLRDDVTEYLRKRELVTDAYREVRRSITLDRPRRPKVEALTYVVNRGHEQYAGVLDREAVLAIVRNGHGRSGANVDYVLNTAGHLRELGFSDDILDWLAKQLANEAAGR